MLEISWRGSKPVQMNGGGERKFLQVQFCSNAIIDSGVECFDCQDGDNVVMTGVCRGQGYNVGFGTVEGVVLPAHL